MATDAMMTGTSNPTPDHARTRSAPPSSRVANTVAAMPVRTARMGIMGSARNRLRRKSIAYWSIGIRFQRLVRSTANIRIPPAQSPPKKSMSHALI
jgi:hypothetical protein